MTTEQREIKVGQSVRITAKNDGFYGEVGIVSGIPNTPWNCYTVGFGARYGARYYERSEFKIVENNASYELEITVYEPNEFGQDNYSIRTHMNVYPGHSNPHFRNPVAAIKCMKAHYKWQGFYITWKLRKLPYSLS